MVIIYFNLHCRGDSVSESFKKTWVFVYVLLTVDISPL